VSSETIKLTARLKLKEAPKGLDRLFTTYREIVNYLVNYAYKNNITSFYRLKEETYKTLREKYPQLPSHYIYTACQMATSIYKSYRKRERNRIRDLYHKLANKIVDIAEKYGGIALENLRELRERVNYSREMNGRLHRWSFRRLQEIIEYKAKLKGIRVVFVDPAQTSSLYPICGVRLSPNEDC